MKKLILSLIMEIVFIVEFLRLMIEDELHNESWWERCRLTICISNESLWE